MRILDSKSIKQWDEHTIKTKGISGLELMECAARRVVDHLIRSNPYRVEYHICCGPGNNGGDGLAIARLLSLKGYVVVTYLFFHKLAKSEEYKVNLSRLTSARACQIIEVESVADLKSLSNQTVLDCILGIGLNKPITYPLDSYIEYINTNAEQIIAIDCPSGFPDGEVPTQACIKADTTLTFGTLKYGMLFQEAYPFTGEIKIMDIGLSNDFVPQTDLGLYTIETSLIKSFINQRHKFSHKGNYGHAALACGSKGMMGAAILSTGAALRSGLGLLTAYVPVCGYEIIQSTRPEAMCIADQSLEHLGFSVPKISYDAVGIGCGIGVNAQTSKWLFNFIKKVDGKRLVLDADALNLIAEAEGFVYPTDCVLTPHPKEFDRLFGDCPDGISRHKQQLEMSLKHQIYIVLKGANTCITTPMGKSYFNTTGNPGMACGGSGDVLLGLITGLMAQAYTIEEACLIGVYVHGLAGDAAAKKISQHAMKAGDLLDYIGTAFLQLEVS